MEVELGTAGLDKTFQAKFEPEVDCAQPECDGKARIGFVAHEIGRNGKVVAELHENEPDGEGYWLHDPCAVAVYFCRKCLQPTARYNQA